MANTYIMKRLDVSDQTAISMPNEKAKSKTEMAVGVWAYAIIMKKWTNLFFGLKI